MVQLFLNWSVWQILILINNLNQYQYVFCISFYSCWLVYFNQYILCNGQLSHIALKIKAPLTLVSWKLSVQTSLIFLKVRLSLSKKSAWHCTFLEKGQAAPWKRVEAQISPLISIEHNNNVLHTLFYRAKEKPQKLTKKMSNLKKSIGSVRRLDVRLPIQFVLRVHLKGWKFYFAITINSSLFCFT